MGEAIRPMIEKDGSLYQIELRDGNDASLL